MLRVPRGWAIQKEVFDHHEKNVDWFEIEDVETGVAYQATPRQIRTYAQEIDRGHGPQYVLILKRWVTVQSESKQLSFLDSLPNEQLVGAT